MLQEVNEVFHVQVWMVLITYFPDFHNTWEYIIFLHFGQGTSEKLSGSWDCAPVDLHNTEVTLTLPPSHVTRASCGETLWGCSFPMCLGVSSWFSEMSQWCWKKNGITDLEVDFQTDKNLDCFHRLTENISRHAPHWPIVVWTVLATRTVFIVSGLSPSECLVNPFPLLSFLCK